MKTNVAIFTADLTVFEALELASKFTAFKLFHNPEMNDYLSDHFIICDVDYYLAHLDQLGQVEKHLLYVLSSESDESNMQLVEKHHLHHLVGLNREIFAAETLKNIKKTQDKKIWGLKQYLEEDSEIVKLSLSDSKNTNEMIQDVLGHFDFKDYFSSPVEYIQVMANELISNSLYKGPSRKRSEQGLDQVERKSPVFLKGSELVQVNVAMDNSGVFLSVQDSFGGLSYEKLISSLIRSFNEKTPMDKKDGAGLGLYLTFLHSNQFIINYKKDLRTEVICIIEKNKRYKNYKQRIRSFHFFQEVTSEKTNDK